VFTHHADNAPNDKQNANRRSQEQQPGAGPSVWKRGEYAEQRPPPLLLQKRRHFSYEMNPHCSEFFSTTIEVPAFGWSCMET